MPRTPKARVLLVLSVLFALGPVVAVFIRYRQTGGQDLKMLWVALAALLGAVALMLPAISRPRARRRLVGFSVIALAIATALGTLTGVLLGAVVIPTLMVAGVISFFWVMSFALRAPHK